MFTLQLVYIAIILVIGLLILSLRRKAKGSKSFYKITLLLAGAAIAVFLGSRIEEYLLKNLTMLLLITLTFELGMRLTPENLSWKTRPVLVFLGVLVLNLAIVSALSFFLLGIEILPAIILAIMLSATEYFMVDELRKEGDIASPLIIILAFALMFFGRVDSSNIFGFVQYLLIGIATGVFIAIIISRLLKPNRITWMHELALLSCAYLTYLGTEYLGGFGLISITILGAMFGNSYVRKRSEMKTFSPFIFKSLEIFIFMLIGFVFVSSMDASLLWKAAIIFLACLIIRLLVVSIAYRRYSLQNKILLSLAPKGMVFGILLLMIYPGAAILYILIYSLVASWTMELIQEKKVKRMDRIFEILKNIRYGRKKDLKRFSNKSHKSL